MAASCAESLPGLQDTRRLFSREMALHTIPHRRQGRAVKRFSFSLPAGPREEKKKVADDQKKRANLGRRALRLSVSEKRASMWIFLEQKRVRGDPDVGTRTCGNWLAGAVPGIYPAHVATRLHVFPLSKHRRSFQVPKVAQGSAPLTAATRARRRRSRHFLVSSRNDSQMSCHVPCQMSDVRRCRLPLFLTLMPRSDVSGQNLSTGTSTTQQAAGNMLQAPGTASVSLARFDGIECFACFDHLRHPGPRPRLASPIVAFP